MRVSKEQQFIQSASLIRQRCIDEISAGEDTDIAVSNANKAVIALAELVNAPKSEQVLPSNMRNCPEC